jgi:MHS family proline/betaine transporter-like MFS transporter
MSLSLGVPVPVQRGMVLVNLFVCVVMMLLAGAASDRGLPRLVSANSVFVVAGAITAPVLLYGMRPNALASVWLLHALLLALVGWVLGVIPAACSVIYPPAVRTTGFNLGHNASMSWLGGLSPTIVTALAPIAAAAGNKFLAPSVLLVAAAGASLAAGVMLMWYAPAANKRPAAAADGAGAVVELRGQA